MDEYFQIKDMGDGIFHIWEPGKVASSLIIGEKKALLIDTGYGFSDIRETVEKLTALPYEIVNTHGHLDHAGGNYLFDRPAWIHPCETAVYEEYQKVQKPLMMAKYLREQNEKPLPWGPEFDMDAYLEEKQVSFRYLENHQIFDLGGRRVTVIFLPGHTMGSVVLFDEKTGTLFGGDNLSSSLWIMFTFSEDVRAYAEHLDMLKEYPIRRIISSHSMEEWPPELIGVIQDGIRAIRPEDSRVFIHPRTGVESRLFKYPIPEMNGATTLYIVYDHHRW